ncbi:hypothetical protein BCR32DRAFT_87282 [Anaeromyces robustus]|uniref:RNI-like protein n=1 Tax=Anaeromyces robustus TaxID=1754192 RepID=A0A1Y1WQU3_9FUNG|nr:hypothetical protein BCR32DRAFT_87282 [Anaeromyces robustus]|eukprot:ORX75900.1 hypothetical protein BCR32DRAFT_87282 [Anaeromyces robustus]
MYFNYSLNKDRLIALKYLNIINCIDINYMALEYIVNGCPNLQKFECSPSNLPAFEILYNPSVIYQYVFTRSKKR